MGTIWAGGLGRAGSCWGGRAWQPLLHPALAWCPPAPQVSWAARGGGEAWLGLVPGRAGGFPLWALVPAASFTSTWQVREHPGHPLLPHPRLVTLTGRPQGSPRHSLPPEHPASSTCCSWAPGLRTGYNPPSAPPSSLSRLPHPLQASPQRCLLREALPIQTGPRPLSTSLPALSSCRSLTSSSY